MMSKELRTVAAYVLYPFCFLVIGCLLWIIGGEQIYRMVDANICMLVTNNAPKMEDSNVQVQVSVKDNGKEVDQGEYQVPEVGSLYGSIICMERGLLAPLYYGDDEKLLRLGAGQYQGSALPGRRGISIIGAHDSTYFAPLEDVQIGDEIAIQTKYGDFLYRVNDTKIAESTDTSAYQLEQGEETVILYTCYPFGQIQEDRNERYYVYCERTQN